MEPLTEPRPRPAFQDYLEERRAHGPSHRRFISQNEFAGLLEDPDEWARREVRRELRAHAIRQLFPTFAAWFPRLFYHYRVRPESPATTRAAARWIREQLPKMLSVGMLNHLTDAKWLRAKAIETKATKA